jgi:hypothetical protein
MKWKGEKITSTKVARRRIKYSKCRYRSRARAMSPLINLTIGRCLQNSSVPVFRNRTCTDCLGGLKDWLGAGGVPRDPVGSCGEWAGPYRCNKCRIIGWGSRSETDQTVTLNSLVGDNFPSRCSTNSLNTSLFVRRIVHSVDSRGQFCHIILTFYI